MKFFNPQEDVLDIQLTQVGKRNLAAGKFSPTYYAFYDTDILYDVGWAGFDENQNEGVPRIIDNTPRLRTQYLFDGAESNFRKLKKQKTAEKKINNESMDRSLKKNPLGSSTGNEYLPSWRIVLGESEITNVVLYSSASWGVQFTPQLSSSVKIKTRVEINEELAYSTEEPEGNGVLMPGRPLNNPEGFLGNTDTEPAVYPDGTYLVTEQASLLLDVGELNSIFKDENFDIEIFDIITDSTGTEQREILRPLKFLSRDDLAHLEERAITEEVKIPDTGHVAHYVDVLVDGEIDASDLDKFSGRKRGLHGLPIGPYGNGDLSDADPDDIKEPC